MNKKVYSAPLFVCWDLTYKCNLKCKHCCFGELNNYSDVLRENISLNRAYDLLDELDMMGVTTLEFAGGEPLMHKHFMEIYEYASTKRYKLSLVTNGLLLNENLISIFKKLKIGRIQISLDGLDEEMHEFIRGTGTFNKTIENIKYAIREKIPILVATVVNKKNYIYLSEFASFLVNLGVKNFRIQFLLPLGNAITNSEDLVICHEEQILSIRKLYENPHVKEGEIQIILPCFYKAMINGRKKETKSHSFYSNECGAGTLHANINPYGDVTACALLTGSQWIEGNIHQSSFKEIWRNPNVFKIWRNDFELDDKCKKCKLYAECSVGCKAMGFTKYHEDLLSSNSLCWREKNEMLSF